jgi:hypothetical protein
MKPLEKYISDDVGETGGVHKGGIEDQVTIYGRFGAATNPRVKGERQRQIFSRTRQIPEDDVPSATQSHQSFATATRTGRRAVRTSIGDSKQFPQIAVDRDLLYEIRGRAKPASGVIIVIFIEVIGNFLDQTLTEDIGISVENDGSDRSVARGLSEKPLMKCR